MMLTVHYIKLLAFLALPIVSSCFKHNVSETVIMHTDSYLAVTLSKG
jgi:hypothetical protein